LAFSFWIETSIETCTGIRVPGSLWRFFAVAGFFRALRCSGEKARRGRRRRRSAIRRRGGGGGGRRRQARRNVEEARGS